MVESGKIRGVYFRFLKYFCLVDVGLISLRVDGQLWPEYGPPLPEFEPLPGYIPQPPQPMPFINPIQEFYAQNNNGQSFVKSNFEDSKKSEDGISALLSNLATKLPEMAEKMSKIVSLTAAPPQLKAGFQIFPERIPNEKAFGVKNLRAEEEPIEIGRRNFERAGGIGLFFSTEPSVKSDKLADLINSMPEPSSLFSFNNLFSALSGKKAKDSTNFSSLKSNEDEEKVYDMRLIHGTPIEKEEDSEPETYEKEEFASVNEKPEVVSKLESIKSTTSSPPTNSTLFPTIDFGDNILGKIITGRIDKIDWLGTFLPNEKVEGEGNALSSILKGGIFGSGMDDAKIKNKEDNLINFH